VAGQGDCEGPFSSVEEALELLPESCVRGRRVLVKPNWVADGDYPETTEPQLLRLVVERLLDCGARPVVGDDPSLFFSDDFIDRSLAAHALLALGVPPLRLRAWGWRPTRLGGFDVHMSMNRILDEVDFVVSLPVLKAHREAGVTGAQKNLVGLLDPAGRLFLHSNPERLTRGVAWLPHLCPPCWTMLDARSVMLGANLWRFGGHVSAGPGLFCGWDSDELDARAASLTDGLGDRCSGSSKR
jgi:uncharacterized protein (DUF362 family)